MKKLIILMVVISTLLSCVSKKKYVALEKDLSSTKADLGSLQSKLTTINNRVKEYNSKINSLNETNNSLNGENNSLSQSLISANNEKLVLVSDNSVVISKDVKARMNKTLSKLTSEELEGAKTLKDSLNLAISYNLIHKLDIQNSNNDFDLKIDKTVVMISVSDKMLFNSGSYRINKNAGSLLQKLAEIINSEPSMDVIIEGHTDAQTIKSGIVKDNWDLSVKRSTAIVRELQKKYKVDPSRLIASGRSSYVPVADNTTKEGRAKNRRTNIIILPNLNKFFALLAEDDTIVLE